MRDEARSQLRRQGQQAARRRSSEAAAAVGEPKPRASASVRRSLGASRSPVGGSHGRTGWRVTPTGEPRRKPEKTLGGEQVEGRQAVRELLIAGRRRVREIWVASDLDENETVADIVAIAEHERVQVQHVARKRLEAAARSEAPQGVIAYANGIPEAELSTYLERTPGQGAVPRRRRRRHRPGQPRRAAPLLRRCRCRLRRPAPAPRRARHAHRRQGRRRRGRARPDGRGRRAARPRSPR